MIHILRGSTVDLRSYCLSVYFNNENTLWLDVPPVDNMNGFNRFWAGVRYLLPQIRSILGDHLVQEAISHHRPAASLVLHRLTTDLTSAEKHQRNMLAAQITSHLNHNWFMQFPLIEEWAALLHKMLLSDKFTLIIPNFSGIDIVTMTVLRTMCRMFPDSLPHIIIGYDKNGIEPLEADENGITWNDKDIKIENILLNFRLIDDTIDESVPEVSQTINNEKIPPMEIDPLDDDLDYQALANFAKCQATPNDEMIKFTIEAMYRSFQVYDFRAALYLGLKIIEYEPLLTQKQAAFVHGIIGVSAHNRQFSAKTGNAQLNDFLEYHFMRAFGAETEPVRRISHLYRLIVTLARRKRKFHTALDWANKAVAEVKEMAVASAEATMQEAWIRNIRAYIHISSKDIEKALTDIELAYKLVERAASFVESPSREMSMTSSVIADNYTILAKYMGDYESEEQWLCVGNRLIEEFGVGARFIDIASVDFYRSRVRMDLAIQAAFRGLADARVQIDAHWQGLYLRHLSDLHYRVGNYWRAYEYLEEALSFYKRFGQIDRKFSAELMSAAALARAGLFEQAQVAFERAFAHELNNSPHSQAEILTSLALLATRQGKSVEAEGKMNEAIALAVEGGERNTLLLVARRAGDACQYLGNTKQAEQAYRQAITISKAKNSDSAPPPAAEMVGVFLGLLECGEKDSDLALQALRLMPTALQEDADAWWDLPRLLLQLSSMASKTNVFDSSKEQEALENVLIASSQRKDCQKDLSQLLNFLPASMKQFSL